MITLAILEFFLSLGFIFLSTYFSGFVTSLSQITQMIDGYSVPQTLIDVLSIAAYFLPMGTITTLLFLTFTLIAIKLIVSFIHFVSVGFLWN